MNLSFALNHMVAPATDHASFFDLAASLGIGAVEIRNDLPGVAMADGTPASVVREDANERRLAIISINALQRFNEWTADRAAEAVALASYARGCGAKALVLCPVNDPFFSPSEAERLSGLRQALRGLRPILQDAGIIGLIEPLGFHECSLRLKAEAVAAVEDVDGAGVFRLVHDTFHHHVAGEQALFPDHTGLVHVSGVTDPSVAAAEMRDPVRVLVDGADRIGNIAQIEALLGAGYRGWLSFEPFAAAVHRSADIKAELRKTIDFVAARLRVTA